MRIIAIFFTGIFLVSPLAHARPVSYPGGWTLILTNDVIQNSALAHYTLDTQHSLGLRIRHDREGDFIFTGAQLNRLVKRWNTADSQANLYARIGVGAVSDNLDTSEMREDRGTDIGFFLDTSADWETRRYFTSATAQYWNNGRFGEISNFQGRLGVAPYIANTGSIHTWLMVEGRYRPQNRNEVSAAILLRFFKGPALFEIGVDDAGEPLLNYTHRF
ncbi:MAG: hypothetical protein ABJG88_12685 [Litorimonas sp.]